MNVIAALVDRLSKASAHNHATELPPAVILWTDGERKWEPALPKLRQRLPNLWTFGPYDPALEQGPAPWVKWRLGQVSPGEPVPVLYLPGIHRLQFRSLEDFPDELKAIAELQFRGTWWTQVNGKDWTPLAFLTSKKGGLGLNVAEDADTISTLERLVVRLLDASVSDLQRSRLEADHFVPLLTDDLEGDVLDWMDNPPAKRATYNVDEWHVLVDTVRRRLQVELDGDGPLVAAERLIEPRGGWKKVWARYAGAVPSSYGKVHLLLEKARPSQMPLDRSRMPSFNDEREQALRTDLEGIGGLPEVVARKRIRKFEAEHGVRRGWVWAKLGKARLAEVLRHLVSLADATEAPVGGVDLAGVASWYASKGHHADGAALAALAAADHADGAVIRVAVRAVYLPWLQRAADRLRDVVKEEGYPSSEPVPLEEGTCLLFADGLRWDVGAMLAERLDGQSAIVTLAGRWVAFPPVTGTSKPDISPIRHLLIGGSAAADFTPSIEGTQKPINSVTFRKLMAEIEVQVLSGNETGDPAGRGWTEFGDIDKYGHQHGSKTARHVDDQVRELVQRVDELLAAGWRRVRVATDHGWLIVPDGMPAAKVPAGLSESRWGRCALLKSTSKVDLPGLPWAWDSTVEVTYAPGVCAFYNGTEYAHGGLTVQECYTPVLTIESKRPAAGGSIGELKWLGMRCRLTATSPSSGLRFDLRSKVADPGSSLITAPKKLGAVGTCSVVVPDDNLEGIAAFAVLLAPDGSVLDKHPTTIGGDA